MKSRWNVWAVCAALMLASVGAQAQSNPITIPPAGLVINFDAPAGSGLTSPVNVGFGTGYSVLFSTSGGPGSVGEAPSGAWVLGDNGDWAGGKTFAGVDGGVAQNGSVASMSFDFSGLTVQAVGGFMNFDPGFTFGGGFPLPLYIAAYDANGALLDSYELPLFTPNGFNAGQFYGIALNAPVIAKFVIEGPYAVVDDLTFTTPVPEPSTYAMLLAGLGLLGLAARRARRT